MGDIFDQIAAPKGDIFDQVEARPLPQRAAPERSTLGEIGHGIERGLKTLGYGALKGTQAFWEVPAALTDIVSGATGLPQGGAFHRLAEMAEPPAEWAPQGLPEKVSAGAGQAAVAIPEIMSGAKVLGTGTRAMAALGGVRGAREGGLPGAARGAAEGALLGGVLHGARALPKVAAVPVTGAAFALPTAVRNLAASPAPSGNAPGLLQSGNIDLAKRPVVKNPDGTISSVRSMSFNMDGKEVLIPTVSDDGRTLTSQQAVEQYRRTGKHLGIFDTPANATTYAKRLHESQAAYYNRPGTEDIAADFIVGSGLAGFGPSPTWKEFKGRKEPARPVIDVPYDESRRMAKQVEAYLAEQEAAKVAPIEAQAGQPGGAAPVRAMTEALKTPIPARRPAPVPAEKSPLELMRAAQVQPMAEPVKQMVRSGLEPAPAPKPPPPDVAGARALEAARGRGQQIIEREVMSPEQREAAVLGRSPAEAARQATLATEEEGVSRVAPAPAPEEVAPLAKAAVAPPAPAAGPSVATRGERPVASAPRPEGAKGKETWEMTRAEFGNHLSEVGPLKRQDATVKLNAQIGGREPRYVEVAGRRQLATQNDAKLAELIAERDRLSKPMPDWFYPEQAPGMHRAAVQEALAAGRPVPPEVLAEYPDLAPQAQPVPPKGAVSGKQGGISGERPPPRNIKELRQRWPNQSFELSRRPDGNVEVVVTFGVSPEAARELNGAAGGRGKSSAQVVAWMDRAMREVQARKQSPPLTLQPTGAGEPTKPTVETGQGTLASQLRQFPAPPQSVRPKVEARPEQQQTLGAVITKPDWEGVRARRQAAKVRPAEPLTFHQYVKQSGGIKDTAAFGGEELAEFKRFPGLVNKSGAHMDELAERSIKDGWLPEGSTESDALNLLKQDLRNKTEGKPRIREGGFPSAKETRAAEEAEMYDKGGIKAGELAERLKPGDKVRGALAGTKEDTYTYQGKKGGKHVFKDHETLRLNSGQWVEEPERLPRHAAKGEGGPEFGMGLGVLGEKPVEKVKAEAAAAVKGATDWAKRKGWMTPDEVDAIKDTDYTNITKFAQLPDDVARSHPEFKPVYKAQQARERERSSMQTDLYKTGGVGDTYFRLKPQAQVKVNNALNKGNRTGVARFEDYQLDGMGLGAKERAAYNAVRDVMESVEKDYPRQLREMGFEENEVAALEGQIKAHPGYMPQVRLGDWRVVIKGKDGETAYAGGAASKAEANRMALDIAKEYPTGQGFTRPKVFKSKRLPEEVFMEANPEAIKAIFEAADFPVDQNGNSPSKVAALRAVDDVIKTRGWRQRFIGRKDVPGYTTDFAPVIASYLNGYAGFISKLRAAKAMRGAILDIDATIKPELYKFAHDYTNYTLTDTPEFQKARGAMFMWYLAGNVKTALIQPTANFTSFYPLLATRTKGAFWKTNKAMTDVARNYPALVSDTGKPSLKPEEVKFLKEGLKEGELGMGGLAEISGVKGNVFFNRLSGATSKGMRALAAPLAIAEKYSRLSSGLAAFRHFRFEKGMDYAAAKQAAYDLSNEAQGRYGKGNRAPIEQGRPGVVMAFKHFSLNYLTMLKNMAKNKEYGGLVRSAAMMTVLAGTTGWPLAKVLAGAYRTVFKKDPEEEVRKAAGEFGGRALTRGLPAAFGADLSGSIGAGDILPLTNLRDESDIARALIGPGWDLAIHKPYIAWQQAKKGDLRGLAETASPEFIRQKMVAERGYSEGIKGFGKLTGGEAALKSFGVMPTRLSEYYHKKYEVGKLADDDKAPPALDWTRPRRRERRRRVEW